MIAEKYFRGNGKNKGDFSVSNVVYTAIGANFDIIIDSSTDAGDVEVCGGALGGVKKCWQ